jgi:quercetin dioxygenase-like cupin family protein
MAKVTSDFPDLIVFSHSDANSSSPEPGLTRRVLAYNEKLFVVEHKMEKGWAGTMHSHPHEQAVYIVQGHIRLNCQGKTFDLRNGDTFVVRGGIEHGASAVDDSVVVDIFTPLREDYVSG